MKCSEPIAILMATYNGAAYLGEQIDSVLAQTSSQWHLYVHDDDSVDGTPEVLAQYMKRFPQQITVLHYPAQGGACRNFISMLEAVEASYYMFADQDDVWLPEKVERTFARMRDLEIRDGRCPILIHTDLYIVDAALQVLSPSFVRDQQIRIDRIKTFEDYASTNTVTGCTALFNEQAKLCMKRPCDKAMMHDSWICLSVAACGGVVDYIDEPLVKYRQHGTNALGATDLSKMTLLHKLRTIRQLILANMEHYDEMNAVKPISVLEYVRAKIRYKR